MFTWLLTAIKCRFWRILFQHSVYVIKLKSVNDSVVTAIEISPPPRWLATTEPTPPPLCFTVFSAVFLGTVYCASVFCSAACSDSHLMPRHLIPCETWTERTPSWWHRLPSPHAPASQLARFGQHDVPAMRRGLRSSHLLLCGRRRSRASKSSAQPCWPRRSQATGLTARLYVVCPPRMRWLTSLKWSFCQFAKNFGLNMLIRLTFLPYLQRSPT